MSIPVQVVLEPTLVKRTTPYGIGPSNTPGHRKIPAYISISEHVLNGKTGFLISGDRMSGSGQERATDQYSPGKYEGVDQGKELPQARLLRIVGD